MQNFFKIFKVEEQFEIDLELLDKNYFALLSTVHPDTQQHTSNMQDAILINQGYNILKDEWERAAHILELHGFFIKDDAKAPKLSTEILEYIIELHEKPIGEIKEILSQRKSEVSKFLQEQSYQQAALKMLEIRYISRII